MVTEVRLPQWSMGMQEGMVANWLRREGDQVAEGDDLVEIEAAKVTDIVRAPVGGFLARILVQVGETVPVRTVLALVADRMEELAGAQTAPPAVSPNIPPNKPAVTAAPEGVRVHITPVARRLAQEAGVDLSRVRGTGPGGRITEEDVRRALVPPAAAPSASPRPPPQVEPRARRLAQDHGIELSRVTGTGPGGRITEADVRRALETVPPAAEPAGVPAARTIPLTGMRAAIARNMHTSLHTMAQVTLTSEADVTDFVALRSELMAHARVTYTDLIVKAVALALKEHPRLNAMLDGQEIRLLPDIHIGVAVALDDGLIVPVVRHADRKPIYEISAEIARLAEGARQGTLTFADVGGSTFSVTNLGVYDIDAFTPIINPPEAAILGVGRVVEVLARHDNGIVWRQRMTLSLTFDHRIVDGAPAAAFLKAVKTLLESPSVLRS